jgi:hypothetical protein
MKTTPDTMEERQARIADLIEFAEDIADALSNAESCETPADLDANLDEASDNARNLLKLIAEVLS